VLPIEACHPRLVRIGVKARVARVRVRVRVRVGVG